MSAITNSRLRKLWIERYNNHWSLRVPNNFTGLNDALTALGDSPCATSIQTVILTHCTDLKDEVPISYFDLVLIFAQGIKALGKLTSLRKLGLAFAWQGMWEARNISDATFVQARYDMAFLDYYLILRVQQILVSSGNFRAAFCAI